MVQCKGIELVEKEAFLFVVSSDLQRLSGR
jgi:hypothetical protein